MADATERLVNLALRLAAARGPVSATRIRDEVEGYPAAGEQDDDAFKRMLERDKDQLRENGFVIEADAEGNYRLDAEATFASRVTLGALERAVMRAAGLAMLSDPSFPFAPELRFALAKLSAGPEGFDAPLSALLADEDPVSQGASVAIITGAIEARKTLSFRYTNSLGEHKTHTVEPYGVFALDGRWYLVARDPSLDETRTYAVTRAEDLAVNPTRPRHPDFERPADFDVGRYINLPFQYGAEEIPATIVFARDQAWRAPALCSGVGTLTERDDGTAEWHVTARDGRRLLRWMIENGPGLTVAAPSTLTELLREEAAATMAAHEGACDA